HASNKNKKYTGAGTRTRSRTLHCIFIVSIYQVNCVQCCRYTTPACYAILQHMQILDSLLPKRLHLVSLGSSLNPEKSVARYLMSFEQVAITTSSTNYSCKLNSHTIIHTL